MAKRRGSGGEQGVEVAAVVVEEGDEPDAFIRVRGARVHNLRDVSVDIPRDKLVVLTGVSGSGKSSLAFDTIYAEGQRRYIEGLSSYARQFLDQMEPPDVDLIDGLPPTVAIDQRAGTASPRSTVATVTEIHDYLRLLYARVGIPHCPSCGEAIRRQAPEQMVRTALALGDGRKVLVLAPLVRARKGLHRESFEAIRRAGLLRARVDGQVIEIADDPILAKTKVHTIEAVVDRLVIREGIAPRLSESVDLALKLGDGSILLSAQAGETWDDLLLSTRFACPACGLGFEPLEPRSFSFNSPQGACPACDGLGTVPGFDPELVLPDRSKSVAAGAIAPWNRPGAKSKSRVAERAALDDFLARLEVSRDTPLAEWPDATLQQMLKGDKTTHFDGIIPMLEREYKTEPARPPLEAYRGQAPCPACNGARLKPESRAVSLGGMGIHGASALAIDKAFTFFDSLIFEPEMAAIGPPLVREIIGRLTFLRRVGLGYLSLDRPADTLSGGELQRVRLATQTGSGLVGVCYILDEPTAGLHPRDTGRLLDSLAALRDAGNSVLVVEHDEATIRAADWVLDIGPGAGPDGGRIVAEGPPDALVDLGGSRTIAYLARTHVPALSDPARLAASPGSIDVIGAREHNLKNVDARFPVGCLTCVAGVSGSGKSTLVHDVLARAVRRALEQVGPKPGAHDRVDGLAAFDKLIEVDQSPIGRGPRSTPATYTGVFDEIRKVYALTREAKVRGYKPNRFSFNVKGGRCERCEGQGMRRVAMQFLADLYVGCESCHGLRFNRQTLEARYKGKSIGEVLLMRVDEALPFFDAVPKVRRGLQALHEAGLGYVTLGQSSTTLSGGEAQRVKLAAELGRASTGRTLYILDEPTTGLHFADVANLLLVLQRLVDMGNTMIVIEHNLDVIAAADWVVDLGPDGGDAGGHVVAQGSPAGIAADPASVTGAYLRPQP
ncbi:excinuclease ABC subunit UvrA [Isosphaeraceae bacterium EP7]